METPVSQYTKSHQRSIQLQILLNRDISPSIVCSERPVNVKESATFVIDVTKLAHEKDVLRMHLESGATVGHTLYLLRFFIRMMDT